MTGVLPQTISSAVGPVQPIIRIDSVAKRFPVRKSWSEIIRHPARREYATVLNRVTFSVAEGEFFGLLGQNGAGKTTLFRILSTLVLPDSGSVEVGGVDVLKQPAAIRKLVAPVIASERSLYWRLNARENLRLFAVLQQVPEQEIRSAIDRVLAIVSLADTGQKLVGSFSSGMRQRLLIARALLAKPRVLLLDEPTRSLDPISARDFRHFLRETIVGEQRCTVLLATHDAEDVWKLCDRVAVLDRGDLVAIDRTESLRAHVGDEVYSVLLRGVDEPRHRELARSAGVTLVRTIESADEGWVEVLIQLPGGPARVARYIQDITNCGLDVGRFARKTPDLADLLERVVRASRDST